MADTTDHLASMPGDDEASRWLAELSADDAARGRERERRLRQQAQEDTSMLAVLHSLAERQVPVSIATAPGRTSTGRVIAVGEDFVALATGAGRMTLVALWTVGGVAPAGHTPPITGRATPMPHTRLAWVFASLAGDGAEVILQVGGETLRGELESVGTDVALLRRGGRSGQATYVRLASVAELSVAIPRSPPPGRDAPGPRA